MQPLALFSVREHRCAIDMSLRPDGISIFIKMTLKILKALLNEVK